MKKSDPVLQFHIYPYNFVWLNLRGRQLNNHVRRLVEDLENHRNILLQYASAVSSKYLSHWCHHSFEKSRRCIYRCTCPASSRQIRTLVRRHRSIHTAILVPHKDTKSHRQAVRRYGKLIGTFQWSSPHLLHSDR